MKILKSIFLILNAILAALLVCSTLAGSVKPSSFIGFTLLGYCYLYLLAANIVCALVWLLMGSKWFILPVLAIVVRWAFVPLYFQVGGTEELPSGKQESETIKVLTFNAHLFNGIDIGSTTTDTNMACFLEIVDKECPDVMAMQEYIGRGDTLQLTERLRQRGYKYMVSGYENGSITGEVIISKLPILRVVRIEGPAKLYAELKWGADTLRLYCLHLGSYGLDGSDQQQIHDLSHGNVDSLTGRKTWHKFRATILQHENEWELLQPYFDNHRRLSVVAGDLNDPPASYFYQQCRNYLKDSYCEAGQGFSTTYHGLFTTNNTGTFPAFRIDMVLHTPDLEALTYGRIKSEMSDHNPVIVTLARSEERE